MGLNEQLTSYALDVINAAYGTVINNDAKGFTNVSQSINNWLYPHFLSRIKKAGGSALKFGLNMRHGAIDPHAPADGIDTYNKHDDAMVYGEVGWGKFQFPVNYNVEDVVVNRTDPQSRIVYLTQILENVQLAAAEAMEALFMTYPESVTEQQRRKTLLGITYWIPQSADAELGKLTLCGKNPTGWNSVAGIDTSDDRNKNYRSWAGKYPAGDFEIDSGFISIMQDMCDKLNFVSPTGIPVGQRLSDNREFKPAQYRFFTNKRVMDKLKLFRVKYMGGLGTDITYPGCTFCQQDFVYIPALDQDAKDPVYCVHDSLQLYGLDGMIFSSDDFKPLPNRHLEVGRIYDLRMQLACHDRKRQAVVFLDGE